MKTKFNVALTTEELERFCLGCEHVCDTPCEKVLEARAIPNP